ncbi:hypothetical protein CKO28_13535 [Rhodovibrio sodomensis]|uniref:Uncharacterized protein n=1 Tax=Rhodovibrio sodomensis TaxID=1088 RepID=A0ABS1DF15_9PROT|nr:hypothetical protein [Rhodovibrio sodomensis]MBK1669055.1 hypothetical protein [Rhodovibrio sodomensis]
MSANDRAANASDESPPVPPRALLAELASDPWLRVTGDLAAIAEITAAARPSGNTLFSITP